MKSVHITCAVCNAVNRIPVTRLSDHPVCGRCHKRIFTGEPLLLNVGNFKDHVLRSELPVLVDFWAPWCGPCQVMAPVLEQAARELEPRLRIGKLDTESAPELAGRYRIRSVPTLVLFRQEHEVARQSGAMSLAQLLQWLQPLCRKHCAERGAA